MEQSVLIRGVGLDVFGVKRHELTICSLATEKVNKTLTLAYCALANKNVSRVLLDIEIPVRIEGEQPLTLE